MQNGRWVEVSSSQFAHEREGLAMVKQLLPDGPPFRAWANFEFRDGRGRWHEVDLLVLAQDTLYLIELKHYSGVLRGNDHVWTRGGNRAEDSPLLLTRRKAQYFKSKLVESLAEKTKTPAHKLKRAIPFVQELVFLHHQDFRCELPESSSINLYGIDGNELTSGLPGLSQRLLAPPQHEPVSEERSLLIADLMKAIGLAPRRQREVGSWIIDDDPLGDGEGWQDWPAFHHAAPERESRIRFYLPKQGEPAADEFARKNAVRQEFQLLSRLSRDGLQVPVDIVDEPELGIGLVFSQPKADERLDLWLADHARELTLEQQLELIRRIAEIVHYAHRHRVVHRTLSPRAIAVRARGSVLQPQVTDWDSAGVLPANAETGVTRLSAGPLSLMAGASGEQARLFAAPEGSAPENPAGIDVFGLGALAYYILTGGTDPATERGELMARLRRDRGLDLAADLPQVPSELRQLVLHATHPSPAERIATVAEFVEELADRSAKVLGVSEQSDPLEAGPGAELADRRFEYRRRLGSGSTAVGILVKDRHAGDLERVLKVAKDDEAAGRLRAEAQVLGQLDDEPRIVRLLSEVEVGGRTALLLQYAGRTTLAEELAVRGRLSIDLLERWGTDLLQALVGLERAGVNHRDIKPSNLGVHATSSRADTHLVMFDFSMAGVDPRNVEAGTPPYLDPFLGAGGRRQYDTAAERYGAAVVLFEMATGKTPHYGPDPQANAAAINDDVTVTREMFDVAVAGQLAEFFTTALSREAAERPDTAEDVLRSWKRVFAALGAGETAEAASEAANSAAAQAIASTSLVAAGLSARAASALAAASVATVGELLALDSARLNRLVAKEAQGTRAEIRNRYREWANRLGKGQAPARGQGLLSLDDAVQLLLGAVGTGRRTTRQQSAELLLGTSGGLDAFASTTELAAALGKSAQRGSQVIRELQAGWAEHQAARELLDALVETVQRLLTESGGVVAVATLTAEIEGQLPQPPAASSDARARVMAERAAAGLLRVTLDRLSEHEAAEGTKRLLRRRHEGRLALLATDELLLAAAEAAGKRADQLVAAAPTTVIPGTTAARELRMTFTRTYQGASSADAVVPVPADGRLVRLAAATARNVEVSGRGELHSRTMGPSDALRIALAGLSQSAAMEPREVRGRVAARFPQLDKLPAGDALDQMIARADLGLRREDGVYRYEQAAPPSDTTLHTQVTTNVGGRSTTGPAAGVRLGEQERDALMRSSRRENGFLAIGVPVRRPGDHVETARVIAEQYGGRIVDITGQIVEAMRDMAQSLGASWDTVRGADASEPGSRDDKNLRGLVDRVLPGLRARLESEVFGAEALNGPPLILTEPSPLARYGHMDILARLSDLTAPRRRPVWVVLPQIHGRTGALVDGVPIQLGAPAGQFVTWSPARTVTTTTTETSGRQQ